jgi:two-component system chemotaxis sensor kinase CheA
LDERIPAEQVLDALRSGAAAVTTERIDILLDAVTRLQALVQALAGAPLSSEDEQALTAALKQSLEARDEYAPAAPTPAAGEPTTRRSHHGTAAVTGLIDQLAAAGTTDIPALIRRLAELRQCLAGGQPAALRALAELDCLCDQLVLETAVADPAGRFAGLVADLRRGCLGERSPAPAIRAVTGLAEIGGSAILDEAMAEIADLLAQAESAMLQAVPGAQDSVLRAVHTAKGIAATAGLARLAALAQAVESELEPLRQGSPVTPSVRTLVLGSLDALGELAAAARSNGAEIGPWPSGAAAVAARLGVAVDDAPAPVADPGLVRGLVDAGVSGAEVAAAVRSLAPGEDLTARLVKTGRITQEQAARAQAAAAADAVRRDAFARVSMARLEELVDLIGELLITQAGVVQHAGAAPPELRAAIERQGRTVRSLQGIALGMRLVAIRASFQKMARAVLDTGRKLGKEIDFVTEGDDTELDRTLAETLADPLLHMVRNAADHGIEPPAERIAAGKPAKGRIRLAARHAGEHIVVEIEDDGRGMDPDRLVAKAREKGLLPAGAQPTRDEALALIFAPGFSTAERVSEVSGRGVGMDVVKRNVDSLRGRILIRSEPGHGSLFTIRLPLTTAVLDAMVLRVADRRFLVRWPWWSRRCGRSRERSRPWRGIAAGWCNPGAAGCRWCGWRTAGGSPGRRTRPRMGSWSCSNTWAAAWRS